MRREKSCWAFFSPLSPFSFEVFEFWTFLQKKEANFRLYWPKNTSSPPPKKIPLYFFDADFLVNSWNQGNENRRGRKGGRKGEEILTRYRNHLTVTIPRCSTNTKLAIVWYIFFVFIWGKGNAEKKNVTAIKDRLFWRRKEASAGSWGGGGGDGGGGGCSSRQGGLRLRIEEEEANFVVTRCHVGKEVSSRPREKYPQFSASIWRRKKSIRHQFCDCSTADDGG